MKDPPKGAKEKSSKIQECLNRYSNSENRCIELAKHEAITYNSPHSMEDVESFLKTLSSKQLQEYLKKLDDSDKKLGELENLYFPEKKPTKEEKLYEKRLKRCLRRYWIYDQRCKQLLLRPYLGNTERNRKPFREMEDELYTYSYEQLKEFSLKLHQREWRIQSLESQLRPGVIHFYLEEDFFTKPFTKMWDRTSKMVADVASGISEKIKMMSVKCTNV